MHCGRRTINTDNKPADILADRLQALRDQYARQFPVKNAEIKKSWDAVQRDLGNVDAMDTLYRLAHGLAGSGATFGFPQISDVAQRVEHFLLAGLESGALAPNVGQSRIEALTHALDTASIEIQQQSSIVTLPVSGPATTKEKRIFILDENADRARALEAEIAQYGYRVQVFSGPEEYLNRPDTSRPSAVIVNIEHAGGEDCDAATAQPRLWFPLPLTPAIFLASQESHKNRIAAVRAGGQGFFVRPFDTSKLVQVIDSIVYEDLEPYRVMVIEDDPDQAAQYAAVLEGVGMTVCVTTDPRTLLGDLANFDAELILMDLYLPGCTGLELATVLRQRESETGVPIVFLSTEARIDRQLDALRQGGDDFLTKPIAPTHLAAAITSRVRRARIVRSHMMRDSLTDALNHVAVMDHLEREASRAKRTKSPLTFALLDLDQFKSVNDLYGHGTGDKVIKALSRMLHQRLRRTDVIGRYGGEEFAIVFTDTDAQKAKCVVDKLRIEFSEQVFTHDGQDFSLTFSCGIVDFLLRATAHEIRDAADQALYAAKNSGRNQIAIAPSL